MTRGRRRLAVGALVAVAAVAAGCGQDAVASYCETVSDRQAALSETVAGGDQDALIRALPDFRALAADAPEDIAPSWHTVIDAIEALKKAVASKDEAAITAAATRLSSDQVGTAMTAVQQQVRDVCHTPLTL